MEEIEIGSGDRTPGGGGGGAGFTALDVNAEAEDGDDTINAVFARIDSASWDSVDDLIISPVFKGTDTLAYIDDLESGEVPILYQKFYDDYEDATVTLFSITPRLTHTEISSEDLSELETTDPLRLGAGEYDSYIESYKEYADAVETVIGNFENKCEWPDRDSSIDEVQIENAYDKAIAALRRVDTYLAKAYEVLDADGGNLLLMAPAEVVYEQATAALDGAEFGDNFDAGVYDSTYFICTNAVPFLESAIQELLDSYTKFHEKLDEIAADIYAV